TADMVRLSMPPRLLEPVVQWLAMRHRRGLGYGLVFCALRRPATGGPLDYADLRRRFLRHQAATLRSVTLTLSAIRHEGPRCFAFDRKRPLLQHLVRTWNRGKARRELVKSLSP